MQSGLLKVQPDSRDYSILHTFGATTGDPDSLPDNFSIYGGQAIPDQNNIDTRFTPPIPPIPMGCTGETGAFDCGIQDSVLYDPSKIWANTPPGGPGGRDIRLALQFLIDNGPLTDKDATGPKRTAYFTCYGSGKIDDFDAVRIALWINQWEKRGVWVGSYWYPEFERPDIMGTLPTPSFNTNTASLHCYLITGWRTLNGQLQLQAISWQGQNYGEAGLCYVPRETYNKLMAQPWTGAFTLTKVSGTTPIPIGYQAILDHFVYWFRHLFQV